MAAHDKAQRIAEDASAQRLLNLFFIFNTATRPLSSEEILSDSDLGYGSVAGTPQRESDMRKFLRDRNKLAEQGIIIAEINTSTTEHRGASSWKLDRALTFAAGGVVSVDDAEMLARAIDEYLSHETTPLARPLRSVRNKALECAGAPNSSDAHTDASNPVLDAVWTAFSSRTKLTFAYHNASRQSSKRTVAIYGIFTHEGITYFTGLDDATESIRTFRADRIEKAWRPKGPYAIPEDFDIRERVFLPFDFGEAPASEAVFSLPASAPTSLVRTITRDRGHITQAQNGSYRWTVTVHDVDAAASFALAHAREGLRPTAPHELIVAWNNMIEQAVMAHGA